MQKLHPAFRTLFLGFIILLFCNSSDDPDLLNLFNMLDRLNKSAADIVDYINSSNVLNINKTEHTLSLLIEHKAELDRRIKIMSQLNQEVMEFYRKLSEEKTVSFFEKVEPLIDAIRINQALIIYHYRDIEKEISSYSK